MDSPLTRYATGRKESGYCADDAIVIDDDEISDHGDNTNDDCIVIKTCSQQKRDLQTFMEIVSTKSESLALFYLQSNEFDMERAIAAFLEQKLSATVAHEESTKRHGPSGINIQGAVHGGDTRTTKATTTTRTTTVKNPSLHSSFRSTETKTERASVPNVDGKGLGKSLAERTDCQLSNQWKACYNNDVAVIVSGNGGTVFVDPDFPPVTQSLDGRKRIHGSASQMSSSSSSSSSATDRIQCHCGVPAAARQVQVRIRNILSSGFQSDFMVSNRREI